MVVENSKITILHDMMHEWKKIASELPHVMVVDKTVGSTFKELGLSSSEHPEAWHIKMTLPLSM